MTLRTEAWGWLRDQGQELLITTAARRALGEMLYAARSTASQGVASPTSATRKQSPGSDDVGKSLSRDRRRKAKTTRRLAKVTKDRNRKS